MNNVMRDTKIELHLIGDKNWEVRDLGGNVLQDCEDSYFIYMKNVAFKRGNIITGKYCGELTENSPILDDQCKDVVTDGVRFTVDGQILRRARMLAVNNKTKVILILS